MKRIIKISSFILVIVIFSASLSLADDNAGNTGGFLDGLFAPLSFIVRIPEFVLTGHEGSGRFATHWEKTWGQGSISYRVGFVFGWIVLLSVFTVVGALVNSPSRIATKKDNQTNENINERRGGN